MKVGIATSRIDPLPGELLGGYPDTHRPTADVHDPLLASGLYLDDDVGGDLLLIALDAVVVSPASVAAAIAAAGIRGPVVVVASHTHSAPALTVPTFDQGIIGPVTATYESRLLDVIGDVASAAVRSAAPGSVLTGVAALTEPIGSNRRHPARGGDPFVRTIEAVANSGARLLLAIHGCHPTVLGPENSAASADLVLGMRRELSRAGMPAVVHLLGGGSGDQSTRSTRLASSFAEAERLGRRLGAAALHAASEAKDQPGISTLRYAVSVESRPIDDPTETRKQLDAALVEQAIGRSGATSASQRSLEVRILGLRHRLRRATESPPAGRPARVEMTLVRLGDQAIAFGPFEPFLECALDVDRHGVWLVGYTNDYLGYLLPDDEIQIGGYELDASPFATGTWPRIRRVTLQTMSKMLA